MTDATFDEANRRSLKGEKIALGPLSREMIPLIARWHGDFAVQRTFGGIPRSVTIEQATATYESWALAEDTYWFAIYERSSGRTSGGPTSSRSIGAPAPAPSG